jgi:hypothetical protein
MSAVIAEFKLTKEERHAVFAGTLKVLRRPQKPEGVDKYVVSQTKGGLQILNREEGTTIEVPKEPRLWITFKGWHLKAGSIEWETMVVIHDERETHRVLANGIGGLQREAGLKTRWGTRVIHSGGAVTVVEKTVPTKEQLKEHWTSETERGYGGRNEFEMSAEGDLVQATGVGDDYLKLFAADAELDSVDLRAKKRRQGKQAHAQLKIQARRDHTVSAGGENLTHSFS